LFWQIVATLKKDQSFSAYHVDDKFWDESKAKAIFDKVKLCKQAVITQVKKTVMQEPPPPPFNTTLFLQEASSLGFSASKAMQLAEELYMHGLISYPRTDNTVYPKTLGLKTIVEKLLNTRFAEAAREVLTNGRKVPTRGKKFSSDHPPIHPVNIPTKTKLTSDQDKIYELVCRRFLATLAQNAVAESMDVSLDIGGEIFNAKGYRVIEAHWKAIYSYKRDKRKPLPDLTNGERVVVSKIHLKQDKTRPPSRYTQGMLIAKMEALMLGTKSTRHEIISKLYGRKYVTGSPPIPTATAFAVVDAIREYSVAKPEMTAHLEEDMDNIAAGKKTREDTVTKSRDMLSQVVQSLEKNKDAIRVSIRDALKEQKTIGVCPTCGQDMVIRSSKQGKRFVGCSNYPSCKNTYSLPQQGYLLKTDIKCSKCNAPIIKVKIKGKKYWDMCLNSTCPGKKKYTSDK
jgi:DNA topoisomerase-1